MEQLYFVWGLVFQDCQAIAGVSQNLCQHCCCSPWLIPWGKSILGYVLYRNTSCSLFCKSCFTVSVQILSRNVLTNIWRMTHFLIHTPEKKKKKEKKMFNTENYFLLDIKVFLKKSSFHINDKTWGMICSNLC